MENPIGSAEAVAGLKGTLAEAQAGVRASLDNGWTELIERVFAQQFAEIESRLENDFDAAVNHKSKDVAARMVDLARTSAQRETTEMLNQMGRRLRQAENREGWIRTLLEGASNYCGRAALFQVAGKNLKFEGGLGIGEDPETVATEFPLTSAPAFANVVESRETVVAMGTASELSQTATQLVGDSSAKKVYLFPVVLRQSVVAVLYAEPAPEREQEPLDMGALELIAALAANTLEGETVMVPQRPSLDLVRIASVEATPPDEEIHLRGKRFARTQVAHLMLYKNAEVKAGRAARDVYGTLKGDIDAGREAFRQQFLSNCPSMVDYYHLELVNTIAKSERDILGPGYPGSLR